MPRHNLISPFQSQGRLLPSIVLLLSLLHSAWGHGNLSSAFEELGFDPYYPGNAIVVFGSDVHMTLDTTGLPSPAVTTNLDWRFVKAVKSCEPPPAKIIFCGDESSSLSPVPGVDGLQIPVSVNNATNEMAFFLQSLDVLDYPRSNIVWVPGNHDQSPAEENAELFQRMFPGMPPYQTFDIAGVRFFLVNSGNYGKSSELQTEWLTEQVAALVPTQHVVVVTHQPPFHGTVAHRGVRLLLSRLFADWPMRWWIIDGHEHSAGTEVYALGRSNVVQETVGPVSTNTFMGFTYDVGCMFMCLSNGVAGRVYFHARTEQYYVEAPPAWDYPKPLVKPFESVEGLLWRRLKTHLSLPELVVRNSYDSYDWLAYPIELQWTLDLEAHQNAATHFLVWCDSLATNVVMGFSTNREDWINVPNPQPTKSVYAFAIPEQFRLAEKLYARLLADNHDNNWIGGWGLSTTNGTNLVRYPQMYDIPDHTIPAGRSFSLKLRAQDPYAPPDVLHFTLIRGPAGAHLDPHSGMLTWTPATAAAGKTVEILAKVDDGSYPEMSDQRLFRISVAAEEELPVLRAAIVSGRAVLDWSQSSKFSLESSDSLDGPWRSITVSPPATNTPSGPTRFFRLRKL